MKEPVKTWAEVSKAMQTRISEHQEELRQKVRGVQRDMADSLLEVFDIEIAARKSGGWMSADQTHAAASALRSAAKGALVIADIGRVWGTNIVENPATYEQRSSNYSLKASDILVQNALLETISQFMSENGRMAFASIRTIMSKSGMDFEDDKQLKQASRLLGDLSKEGKLESGYFTMQFRIKR